MARPKEFDEHEVIGKALELFQRQGYDATSVRDLQEQTGLSSSSLYAAFGGKEQLFLRALKVWREVARNVVESISTLKLPLGVEAGIAVVFLAIYLDRLTAALGRPGDFPSSLRSLLKQRRETQKTA